MENEKKTDDLFQNLKEGFGEFGQKVNRMVDDLFAGDMSDGELKIKSDVYETEKFLVIELELAGVKKEEVNVQIHDGILSVKGYKPRPVAIDSVSFLTRERKYGTFLRNFMLPDHVEVDKIKAKYESGVLAIRLPIVRVEEEESEDDTPDILID